MADLNARVSRYCREFLKRTTYGECKGFCPFFGEPFKCSTAYIRQHPEEVEQILRDNERRADNG